MASPFRNFEDLSGIWGHAVAVVDPRVDVVVTVRFPGDAFQSFQDHLRRDSAVGAFNRMLYMATVDVHRQTRGVLSATDVSNACALSIDQIDGMLEAPSDCDAVTLHLVGKRAMCFKWTDAGLVTKGMSNVDAAMVSLLDRANRVIERANVVLEQSRDM